MLYRPKKQALIDAGRKSGTKNYESDQLRRACRRIKDLEAALRLVKKASVLFNGEEGAPRSSGSRHARAAKRSSVASSPTPRRPRTAL
jgi:hypothetical protein